MNDTGIDYIVLQEEKRNMMRIRENESKTPSFKEERTAPILPFFI